MNELNVDKIIEGMTVEQKAELCSGRGSWYFSGLDAAGINEITVSDGPHGLRKMAENGRLEELEQSVPATCFPTAAALASSWNRELIAEVGGAIADEAAAQGVSVVLGPGANIKRSPLCGRNFEYLSEDPLLTGELAASMINAVQKKGIGTSLKHYAANNQERFRMSIDAIVDERSLREIYLSGFEKAVKTAEPWTIMCAYNRLNGEYLSDNTYLLDQILRKEWGFCGIVISDWGACNDRVDALKAGMEIEMPCSGRYNIESIIRAVRNGSLPESILDRAVGRILKIMLKANETLRTTEMHPAEFDAEAGHRTAVKAAAESIVLLKNSGGVLPLKKGRKLLVAGEFAVKPRYQGAGSSRINPTRIDNFLDAVRKIFPDTSYSQGYSLSDESDTALQSLLLTEAAEAAAEVDYIIVLAGLPDSYESEGFDRSSLRIPDSHNALIEALIPTGKPVIVCLSNGAPVEMPWNNEAAAVIECYLGGQGGASALAGVLSGEVNPSGKLAESFPARLEDNPSYAWFPGDGHRVEYREGIYVGYRYYDTAGVPVLYPFGHGLSYSDFEYSGLTLSSEHSSSNENGFSDIIVSLKVKNTGKLAGKEVVQLYTGNPEPENYSNKNHPHRPAKELADFVKLELEPAEEKTAEFRLRFRAFACYSPEESRWIIPEGTYSIMAAASSADIRLAAEITIGSKTAGAAPESRDVPETEGHAGDYSLLRKAPDIIHRISDRSFGQAFGGKVPEEVRTAEWNRSTTIIDFSRTFIGRIILRIALNMTSGFSENNENSAGMFEAVAREMPLRAMAQLSGGMVNMEMVDAIIMIGNRKPLRGAAALLLGWIKLLREREQD